VLLQLIEKFGDVIIQKQRFIWSFKDEKPKALKSIYNLMDYLGRIFLDVRLALVANLVALENDGRITLKELLVQDKGPLEDTNDLMKLMMRLELKHSESVKDCKDFEEHGLDKEKLFFDNLITQ
jgi:hypothetical protein